MGEDSPDEFRRVLESRDIDLAGLRGSQGQQDLQMGRPLRARAAEYVLENVTRIFRGIRKLNEGFWCFTGRPVEWYIRRDVIVPFPDTLIFAVCMDSRMRVYDCRAERAADDDPMCPVDWRGRYEGLVWKSTF